MKTKTHRKLTEKEKHEKSHFDSMAKEYDKNYTYDTEFTRFKMHKKLDKLFERVPKNKALRILEVGAGTGEYTQYIAARFPKARIVALDISPNILAVAKKKCKKYKNISYSVASVYELPYKTASFDIVCGFYILHHLDVPLCMAEISRTLKKGGKALFYEPNLLNPVVLAIKSIPFLKKKAGDSPDEWAINPLGLASFKDQFSQIEWLTSEFVSIPRSVSLATAKKIDQVTSFIGSFPGFNLLGGSVLIKMKK